MFGIMSRLPKRLRRLRRSMLGRLQSFLPPYLFANNEPGAWYDADDLTDAKLAYRRNLLTWTESFDNAVWVKSASTVSSAADTAPDGTLTGWKIVEAATTAQHYISGIVNVSPNTVYRVGARMKQAERTWGFLYAQSNNSGAAFYAYVNLATGVAGFTQGAVNITITSEANGYYYVAIDCLTSVTATLTAVEIHAAESNTVLSYAGDITKGIYVWHPQVGIGTQTYQKVTDWNTEFLAAFPSHALYQDSAGTLAVKTMEDPVGLVLDKKGGLVLGPELITDVANRTFSSDTGFWDKSGVWTIGSGVASVSAAGNNSMAKTGLIVSGKVYIATYDLVSNSGAGIKTYIGSGVGNVTSNTVKSVREIFVANGITFGVTQLSGSTLSITNISVREIPGSHLIQPTSGNRPTWTRRVNLTVGTEFANGVTDATTRGGLVSASTISGYAGAIAFGHDGSTDNYVYTAAPAASASTQLTFSAIVEMSDGNPPTFTSATGSSSGNTFYIALCNSVPSPLTFVTTSLGGSKYRVSVSGVSGTNVANSGIAKPSSNDNRTFKVTAYQVEYGSTATRYQRVNTATDYDYAGFPSKIKHNGTNSFLYTASTMDLSATDKVTVFAGVQKLSNAVSYFIETSVSSTSNAGTFGVSTSAVTSDCYSYRTSGTTSQIYTGAAIPSPATSVLSTKSSISTDVSSMAINGAAYLSGSGDLGTGNFGNYVLYIGARAGTSLWFNGAWTQQIIRGALTSDAQVAQAETYVRNKTLASPYYGYYGYPGQIGQSFTVGVSTLL